MRWVWGFYALLGVGSWVGCSSETTTGDTTDITPPSSASPTPLTPAQLKARSLIVDVRQRFRIPDVIPRELGEPNPTATRPVLRDAVLDEFAREGAWIQPRVPLSSRRSVHPARVMLPRKASGAFVLRDVHTGMWIEVALEGAEDAAGEVVDGYVVYRDAYRGGAHVIHRPTAEGTEDYIVFDEPPAVPEVRYSVALGEKVAGLRLVENVLEFLDEGGAPRLRMTAPWLVEESGAQHLPRIFVSNCEHSTTPSAPWGKPVKPPGNRSCEVRVPWDEAVGLVVLDPTWVTTGSMSTERGWHTATRLTTNHVLVAGGRGGYTIGPALASSEVWDASSGTWAATGTMVNPRWIHVATQLKDGRVLVAGGSSENEALSSSETYEPATGEWSDAGAMSTVRVRAALARLKDGTVLIGGGRTAVDPWGSPQSSSVDVWDPATSAWSSRAAMNDARDGHTATVLADGTVLVAGGSQVIPMGSRTIGTAEKYDAGLDAWISVGSMADTRSRHTATLLLDGRVLVVAGCSSIGNAGEYPYRCEALATGPGSNRSELFEPATGTWTAAPSFPYRRYDHTASLLPDGRVLIVGGETDNKYTKLFDPSTGDWQWGPEAVTARRAHAAATLTGTSILVTGGMDVSTGCYASCERFFLGELGSACAQDLDCGSGFCADGVCCETACDDLCMACSSATSGGANGLCLPTVVATDPRDDCADDGSPSCQQNGFCDGQGACQSYPSQTDCVPEPCDSNAECSSGFCVDGICCDSACDGECEACSIVKKGAGDDGVCGPIVAGTDPDDECPQEQDYPNSCKEDGQCDGAGQCRKYAVADVVCGPQTCQSGVFEVKACDGSGVCVQKTEPCEPYACESALACGTSCQSDDDCSNDAYCESDECIPKKSLGSNCTGGRECSSNICADGVCCNMACSKQCEACNTPETAGTCVPVVGKPVQGREPCSPGDASNVCSAAQCDGIERSDCLGFATSAVICQEASCSDGVAISAARCDGKGNCATVAPVQCGAFVCGDLACLTACDSDLDCAQSNRCDITTKTCISRAICDDDHTVTGAAGEIRNCFPFRCTAEGDCLETCQSGADCVAGFRCNADGRCVEENISASGDDGCGCSVPGPGRSSSIWVIGIGALLVASRRRRAPRVSSTN
jgi:MYXO-CTERM domain-containing protein